MATCSCRPIIITAVDKIMQLSGLTITDICHQCWIHSLQWIQHPLPQLKSILSGDILYRSTKSISVIFWLWAIASTTRIINHMSPAQLSHLTMIQLNVRPSIDTSTRQTCHQTILIVDTTSIRFSAVTVTDDNWLCKIYSSRRESRPNGNKCGRRRQSAVGSA